jgi:hypothetical protein
MQHHDETPDTGPDRKEDRYPPTVWTRYREDVLPWILLIGMGVTGIGTLLGTPQMQVGGLSAAALAVLAVIPTLILEYRADMRYDREHPEEDPA